MPRKNDPAKKQRYHGNNVRDAQRGLRIFKDEKGNHDREGGQMAVTGPRPKVRPDRPANQFGFDARAGFASDYMYRGVTLSDHKPAVGAAVEATFAQLYAGVSVASVKLPTQPAAEIAVSGGVRPKIADIDFDLRMTYYLYPGETTGGTTNGIDYWEVGIRADRRIAESIRVAGAFAYSPNVSNTGAWSWYAAAALGYDVPSGLLPQGIGVSFTGGAGYSWFGNQSQELGAFRCPPISIGKPASRSRARFSASTCVTTTPISRRKTASSSLETPTQGRAAASIPSRTRKA